MIDIQPSRKYPFVGFTPAREIGNDLLLVEGLSKQLMAKYFRKRSPSKDDKVAFLSRSDIAITTLFKILTGEMGADSGTFKWGVEQLKPSVLTKRYDRRIPQMRT